MLGRTHFPNRVDLQSSHQNKLIRVIRDSAGQEAHMYNDKGCHWRHRGQDIKYHNK